MLNLLFSRAAVAQLSSHDGAASPHVIVGIG